SSTPGAVPLGSGARTWACTVALGHERCDQWRASSGSGRRQHDGWGHRDTVRVVVSRPRNHFAEANGTPKLIANEPVVVVPVCVELQNVPWGVSVYWWYSVVRSRRVNATRAGHSRQTS